jgi:hypothetical protein
MAYDFISNTDAAPQSSDAVKNTLHPPVHQPVHEATLFEADDALYGSLQAWRSPVVEEDNDDPLPNLSHALLGDDRLQAFIITDYLANLSPSEFANVANTLANDTLSQLVSLAQHYDPLAPVAVDPLDACQHVVQHPSKAQPSSARPSDDDSFAWVDYVDSDHYHP